jgi:hypothetical protein
VVAVLPQDAYDPAPQDLVKKARYDRDFALTDPVLAALEAHFLQGSE